ncbi:hypothetical protein [Curvibacter gracilis]|uniref:hypothetical protein n=1 Tax=Curvibacter gracilis TaxID=230310 RepID=UPI0012F7673D|nr:hypothetical protein [Curvibacter gracilis]
MNAEICDRYLDDFNVVFEAVKSATEIDRPKRLYCVQLPIGLGGQISIRIDAIILAILFDRAIYFLSKEDYPYGQVFENFGFIADSGFDWEGRPKYSCDAEFSDVENLVFDRRTTSIRGMDGLILPQLVEALKIKLNLQAIDGLLIEGLVFKSLKIKEDIFAESLDFVGRMGINHETIGVHYRRGDKKVESAYVPADLVNMEISNFHSSGNFKSVFIASDTPLATKEVQYPDDLKLIFDFEENRFDNANHKMLFKNRALSDQETRVAIKNIIALASCGAIVGQNNAHFALIAASCIALKNSDRANYRLIDGYFLEKSNGVVSLKFKIKRVLRGFAKKLVPWMTVYSRVSKAQKR